MVKYLTQKEYEELKRKIQRLETEKRKEVAEALRQASSFGDLTENAAFDDAKNAQGFLEAEIIDLRKFLSDIKVIKKTQTDLVQIGSTVYLESNSGKMDFQIVGSVNVDVSKKRISYESPLGQALLGKRKGDVVKIEVPAGKMSYKIIKIN